MVVHDLKNPLASILPNAEYLAEPSTTLEEARAVAADIYSAGQRLLAMVLNLLDVHRAEDGALHLALADVDVMELVAEVAAALARRPAARTLRVELSVPPDRKQPQAESPAGRYASTLAAMCSRRWAASASSSPCRSAG